MLGTPSRRRTLTAVGGLLAGRAAGARTLADGPRSDVLAQTENEREAYAVDVSVFTVERVARAARRPGWPRFRARLATAASRAKRRRAEAAVVKTTPFGRKNWVSIVVESVVVAV